MSSCVLFQLWFVLLTLLSGHSFLDLASCKRALEQAQLAFQILGFPPWPQPGPSPVGPQWVSQNQHFLILWSVVLCETGENDN